MPLNLPGSRNNTYGANSPIDPADLNDLQDQIIAMRASRIRNIPIIAGVMWSGNNTADDFYINGQGNVQFRANGNAFAVPIVLDVGERLLGVTARVLCGATDVLNLKVYRENVDAGLVETQLGATATSVGHASAVESLVVAGLTENPRGHFYTYVAVITCTAFAANPFAYGIFATVDGLG